MDLINWLLDKGATICKGGQEYRVNCPRCGDTKKHLYLNPQQGLAHCFRCGYSGRIEEVLIEGFGVSFGEVRELLRLRRGDSKVVGDKKVKVSFPEDSVGLSEVGKGVERLLVRWCEENSVKYQDLVNMKCRWWNGRLVVPCWKDRNREELWYWVARAIGNVEPKYVNCPSPKGGVIWGVDWYDLSDGYLYVCEGWKDAYKVRGVALLGKEVTDDQVVLISRLAERVRVLLDSDAWREGIVAGIRAGRKIGYSKVEVGFLLGLKDPGEGKDKKEVLSNTVFVSLGDSAGKLVDAVRQLELTMMKERWRKLGV